DLACIFMWIRDLTGFSEVLGGNQREIGPKHSSFQQLAAKQKMVQGILIAQTRPLPWLPPDMRDTYEKIAGKKDSVVCNPTAVEENSECPALMREKSTADLSRSNTKRKPWFWQSAVAPEETLALEERAVSTCFLSSNSIVGN
ncbi:hypothetical protein, partial [Legionella tunisiensis]|uniref:hypothetical protein n=1 Tax=Legionella tunisiensis TaxID=1034944 RepID=UPI000594E9BA